MTAVSFGRGVATYLRGTAELWTVGHPGAEFWNLDPEYRVRWNTSGCMLADTELLTHLPNNLAVRWMVDPLRTDGGCLTGPLPHTPAGP